MSRIFSTSIILYALSRFTDKLYELIVNGFFGRIFSSYTSCETALESGFVRSNIRFGKKGAFIFRKIRAKLSEAFESSFLLGKASGFIGSLLATPLKVYGTYLFFFGVYTSLIYFVRLLVPSFETPEAGHIIFGIGLILVSFPLHLSHESIVSAAGSGRICGLIFRNICGFRGEVFEKPAARIRFRGNLAMFLGLISGLFTLLVDPAVIPLAAAALLFAVIVLLTPEIGLLASVFFLPFFWIHSNQHRLASVILLSFFGYAVKIIRGQRIVRFEIIDISVLFFGILLFFSGVISTGGRDSFRSALVSCVLLLGYFLTVNLIRTEAWLKRCVVALVSSAAIVSVFGIYQYFFGNLATQWIDSVYFTEITKRVSVFFDNSNVIGFFLAIIFPFALASFFMWKERKQRTVAFFAIALILACVVYTWSRGAWIAVIAGTVIFFLIYSRKTLKFLIGVSFILPALPFVLPSSVVSRFASIGDLSESSNLYRYYTWKGTFRAIVSENLLGGIGYGTSAFSQIYPAYAYAGMESAPHSHNLYLEIIISMGLVGFISFAAVMYFFAAQNFEYLKKPASGGTSLITAAGIASVCSALCLGLFDFIWYNYRIFFLFWIVAALSVANARIGRRDLLRQRQIMQNEADRASIELTID